MSSITCTDLRKSFGDVRAVDGFSLEVEAGETAVLLGPSGCGKTTTLRLIAGFERPDSGRISLGDRVLAGPDAFVPPEKRRIGIVFQDYALFPHLDVSGNVAYALGRGADPARVREVLELVGLGGVGARSVNELSGGQQQRVALARALAPAPEVVLLDEPFSNLDASLRARVRDEVREILDAEAITSIFVTHDQEEALSIADKVAVVNEGRVEQVGTPEEVYSRPASRWVARFLGEVEVLSGVAREGVISCELGTISGNSSLEGDVDVLIRPESLAIDTIAPPNHPAKSAVVVSRRFYGHDQMLELRLDSGRMVRARRLGFPAWHPGDRVRVWIDGPADVLARDG
jgi:iron(III) transport system ATP-binding protein